MNNAKKLTGPVALGYSFGAGSAKLASIAAQVVAADLVADAAKGELKEDAATAIRQGMGIYYCEQDTGETYLHDGADSYQRLGAGETAPDGKGFVLNGAVALSYETAELSKLKGEQPNLHALVSAKRKAIKTLISNSYNRLVALIKAGQSRGTRGATQEWAARVGEQFETLCKAAKNARTRGDTSVPDSDAKIKAAFAVCLKALSA